ncbi:MAG: hypothetical protein N2Z21_04065, partial [Candidatus Sumerlaeaceae bacterium]|nr:hypothetical protein [Candidatus Sumerlaeaceae bacterium]
QGLVCLRRNSFSAGRLGGIAWGWRSYFFFQRDAEPLSDTAGASTDSRNNSVVRIITLRVFAEKI